MRRQGRGKSGLPVQAGGAEPRPYAWYGGAVQERRRGEGTPYGVNWVVQCGGRRKGRHRMGTAPLVGFLTFNFFCFYFSTVPSARVMV